MSIMPPRSISFLLLSVSLLFTSPLYAEQADNKNRYISDVLYVPLRSGQGDQFRIVHKGLASGSKVTLLETDEENNYSFVETNKGIQGWVRSRYLLNSPTANIRLQEAEAKLVTFSSNKDSLANTNITLAKELESIKTSHQQLTQKNAAIEKQFQALQTLSANTIKIDKSNQALLEKNQILQSQVDGLEATKDKLSDNSSIRMFVFGGLLVLLTLIASTIIDGIKRRRSFSNWG